MMGLKIGDWVLAKRLDNYELPSGGRRGIVSNVGLCVWVRFDPPLPGYSLDDEWICEEWGDEREVAEVTLSAEKVREAIIQTPGISVGIADELLGYLGLKTLTDGLPGGEYALLELETGEIMLKVAEGEWMNIDGESLYRNEDVLSIGIADVIFEGRTC